MLVHSWKHGVLHRIVVGNAYKSKDGADMCAALWWFVDRRCVFALQMFDSFGSMPSKRVKKSFETFEIILHSVGVLGCCGDCVTVL